MAARTDLILDLRAGYTPAQIAQRHECSLSWVELVAGTRQPDTASVRRAAAGQRTGKVIPFHMPLVTSQVAPPILWRISCPLGRMSRAA